MPCSSKRIVLEAVIRCPSCGNRSSHTMPADACVFFHMCTACGSVMRPKAGDCCVFCSYGSAPCPPRQENLKDNPAQMKGKL